jgi:hypothetical protein
LRRLPCPGSPPGRAGKGPADRTPAPGPGATPGCTARVICRVRSGSGAPLSRRPATRPVYLRLRKD